MKRSRLGDLGAPDSSVRLGRPAITKRIHAIASLCPACLGFGAVCLMSAFPALAGVCPPTPGNGKICTANDFNVTSAVVEGPTGCTEGETISFVAHVGLEPTANQRYDVGFFVGDDGEPVFDGDSCSMAALVPLEPTFNALSGSGPYRNLDSDACGDVQSSDGVTYRDLTLNSVLCHDSDGDGRLDVSATVTWSINSNQDICSNPSAPASFFPNQSSKCQFSPSLNFPIVVEPAPSLVVSKLAFPASLPAPGGNVLFLVSVRNTSASTDPLTLKKGGLVDNVHGDLDGQGTCALPQVLDPGESYVCSFVAPVTQNEKDTVTATAVDDEGEAVTDTDDATVTIKPAEASMEVVKIASPKSLPEPGGEVDYSVVVANTSDAANLVITGVQDDPYGDVFTKGTCKQPRSLTLGPGDYFACNFKEQVSGQPDDVITDRVTAIATADGGARLEANATASVMIEDVPSAIVARKIAIPRSQVPGGTVTFLLAIQNVSPTDDVTLNSLSDDVYGPLNGKGTCTVPQSLAPGAIYRCEFREEVTGATGARKVDVITVTGKDDDGKAVSTQAAAEVVLTDDPVPAAIEVIKTASPTVVTEPGGTVTFGVTVVNASATQTVTINTLVDDVHGDLNGQGDCRLPQDLQPGGRYSCSFSANVEGNVGKAQIDVITASGKDVDENPVSAQDNASVSIVGAPPSVTLTKTAEPNQLLAPGGNVEFTVTVENTSRGDTLTINSLQDSVFGNLDGQGDCDVPQTLAPGASYQCRFQARIQGARGDIHIDTITLSATTEDGETLSDQARAFVIIRGASDSVGIPTVSMWGLLLTALALGFAGAMSNRRKARGNRLH